MAFCFAKNRLSGVPLSLQPLPSLRSVQWPPLVPLLSLPQEKLEIEPINDCVQNETKKLEEVLTVRHYSRCTIDRYKKGVQLFLTQNIASESKCNNQSAQKEINEYLKFLALKKNVSASTQNQALAALLFYHRFVKNEPMEKLTNVVHAKKKNKNFCCL